MGVDYTLACSTCKEFLDLHKWPIVEEAEEALQNAYGPGSTSCRLRELYRWIDFDAPYKKLILTSDDLRNALENEVPDQPYIHELTPVVLNFASTHEQHLIFLSCDLGDTSCAPWWIQQPGFEE